MIQYVLYEREQNAFLFYSYFLQCDFGFAELLDNLRPVSPKPGHMERIKTPLGTCSTTIEEDEQPFRERFLKINVRHITDGQVMPL